MEPLITSGRKCKFSINWPISKSYCQNCKATAVLAFPLVISQLGHIMVGVVDTAMVGQIGSEEQAAIALSNSLYFLILMFALGISSGATPLIAAAHSKRNYVLCSALLKNSLLVNSVVGVLLFLLLLAISPILQVFGQNDNIVSKATPFLNAMMLGMIPLCIFSGFKQFAEGLSKTTFAMIVTLGANAVNILLNYVFIFGHWGLAPMGMMGSAWASFIARILMAFAMVLYVCHHRSFSIYLAHFKSVKISKDLIFKILSIGIPSGFQGLFEGGAFTFAIVMIGWIGYAEQAAHQIAFSIASISYMVASGLSSATLVRVANQFGLKNSLGIRIAGFSGFKLVGVCMGINALIFLAGSALFSRLFSNDVEVIKISSSLMVVAAAFQLSDGIQVVALGALRGLKDVRVPTAITLFAYWLIGLPLAYFCAFSLKLGVEGIWYGLLFGLTTAAILLFLRFNYVSKRNI